MYNIQITIVSQGKEVVVERTVNSVELKKLRVLHGASNISFVL